MFTKFIFGIAWIGIFIISIIGLYVSIFPAYLDMINFENTITRIVAGGISIIYLLLFIEKLLLLFSKSGELKIKTSHGILKISSSSINNVVKEILNEYPKIKNIKVKNRSCRKKLKIYISVEIISSNSLSEELSTIQEDVKNRVEKYLDLSITEIELKVTKLIVDRDKNRKGE